MKRKLLTFVLTLRCLIRYLIVAAVLIVVSLLSPTHLVAQGEDSDLKATLEVKEILSRGEAVSVRFTLFNQTNEELLVLFWYTPLEGLAGEIFRVERDGEAIPYHGILAKRGVPLSDEYIPIEPKGSVSDEVDLATSYDFSKPGNYTIEFLSPAISHVVAKRAKMAKRLKDLGPVEIPSNTVSVQIVGSGAGQNQPTSTSFSLAQNDTTAAAKGKIVYKNCTSSQENTLKGANISATLSPALAHAYLDGLSTDQRKKDQEYKTWYGSYTSSRYSTVLDSWAKIKNAFTDETIYYNCDDSDCPTSSTYAYVEVGGDIEVFLCKQFWKAPDSGTDTKFGTLIHEVSHEVAGTKDHAYGVSNCKNLAKNDPGKAIKNADSYEYFAEHHKVAGSENLVYSLLLLLVILFAERYRRRRSQVSGV